eukprot:gene7291-8068_t
MSVKKAGGNGSGNGGFGPPKPLPGQPGYGATESQLLEKDTKEMEARLTLLQERMRQQNQENERNKMMANNGSRWKTSKPERGSIRQYGKEVTDKVKRRLAGEVGTGTGTGTGRHLLSSSVPLSVGGSAAGAGGEAAMMAANAEVSVSLDASHKMTNLSKNFATLDMSVWTIDDVSDWLRQLQLEQYVSVFAQNEVDGRVLLEFTLEDLDYLSITVLAHRKLLLREIESRRRHRPPSTEQRVTGLLRSQSASKLIAQSSADRDDLLAGGSIRSTSERRDEGSKVHWSQLQPLASQTVNGPSGGVAVNAADEVDILDEEAERKAFQEAVMEWRRQDAGGVQIVRENDKNNAGGTGGVWVNPFASPTSAGSERSKAGTTAGGGLGGQGDLDEAQEHAEFVKAVEAWRRTQSGTTNGSSVETSSVTMSSGQQADLLQNERSMRAIADTLAAALDKEQEALQRQLEIQKKQAEQRLQQANEELKRMRLRHQYVDSTQSAESETQQENGEEKNAAFDDSFQSDGEDEFSSSYASHALARPTSSVQENLPASTVRVSLIETYLGQIPDSQQDACCIVECSDED